MDKVLVVPDEWSLLVVDVIRTGIEVNDELDEDIRAYLLQWCAEEEAYR